MTVSSLNPPAGRKKERFMEVDRPRPRLDSGAKAREGLRPGLRAGRIPELGEEEEERADPGMVVPREEEGGETWAMELGGTVIVPSLGDNPPREEVRE